MVERNAYPGVQRFTGELLLPGWSVPPIKSCDSAPLQSRPGHSVKNGNPSRTPS